MAEKLNKKRVFKTGDAFFNCFQDYLEECAEKEKLPNVSGFVYFARIARKTFYNQEKAYPFEFDLINSCLEDETLNNTTQPHQIRTLILTNRFRYNAKGEELGEDNENDGGVTFEFKR